MELSIGNIPSELEAELLHTFGTVEEPNGSGISFWEENELEFRNILPSHDLSQARVEMLLVLIAAESEFPEGPFVSLEESEEIVLEFNEHLLESRTSWSHESFVIIEEGSRELKGFQGSRSIDEVGHEALLVLVHVSKGEVTDVRAWKMTYGSL